MRALDDEQREEIRALLARGLASVDIARRLGVPTMRVAAVRAHITMGTYDRGPGPAAHPAPRGFREAPAHVRAVDWGAHERVASVGIDVAERRKGLDLVALDRDRRILVSRGQLTVEGAVAIAMSLSPAVVCIDSPSGWSTSGRSRLAERQLATVGIQSYRTGTDPGDHPFYGWMRAGFEIFERLSTVYPRYRGGEVTGTAAEIFPHASACLLAGRLRSPSTPKEHFRREVLRDAGVAEHQLATVDRVDAALGALTGLIALEGGHSAVGEPSEGMILLPVHRIPPAALPRGRPERQLGSAPRQWPLFATPDRSDRERPNDARVKERSAATAAKVGTSRHVGVRTGRSLDFAQAARFIASIPAGRWTSYKDVASVAGNEQGAQAVGEWLRQHGHQVPNVHRVIRSDGFVAEGFRAAGPGVPANAATARELLRREGVRFDDRGRATQRQRFQPDQRKPH